MNPKLFAQGIGTGALSLVRNTVGGVFTAASTITGAVGNVTPYLFLCVMYLLP